MLHAFCQTIYMPRILMLDDDRDLLLVTSASLRQHGFEVVTYSTWARAAEAIRKKEPDLILLDVFMNHEDGLSICYKLKSSSFTRHIPVIIVSGSAYLAEIAIHEFGANRFVTKPFEISELIIEITSALSKKKKRVS